MGAAQLWLCRSCFGEERGDLRQRAERGMFCDCLEAIRVEVLQLSPVNTIGVHTPDLIG